MRFLPRLTGKIYDWKRLFDFCAEHYIPFVFGHAVYVNEIFIDILAIPLRLFSFQQIFQTRKRFVSVTPLLPAGGRCTVIPFSDLMPRMFVVVTVDTQQLPVAAVRRVVIVVVILVMDRELSDSLA
jgi:hypothetical protein